MGLFSFIGKALKGVSKVAGFIPGVGGIVSKVTGIAGGLLDKKGSAVAQRAVLMRSPMQARGMSPPYVPQRGNVTPMGYAGVQMGPRVLRMSPVMPGGAVSTPGGMMASTAVPPMEYGRAPRASGGRRRASRRRRPAARRASAPRRRGRKLKFGSKAWRAKYLKRR